MQCFYTIFLQALKNIKNGCREAKVRTNIFEKILKFSIENRYFSNFRFSLGFGEVASAFPFIFFPISMTYPRFNTQATPLIVVFRSESPVIQISSDSMYIKLAFYNFLESQQPLSVVLRKTYQLTMYQFMGSWTFGSQKF